MASKSKPLPKHTVLTPNVGRDRLIQLVLVSAVLAVILGIVVAQWNSRDPRAWMRSVTLEDVDGEPRILAEWAGRPLLVNFWATWCPPCREEIPLLSAAQDAYAARGLQVVGIALDDVGPVRSFVDQIGINYPSLLGGDTGDTLMHEFGNRGSLPFTVLIDRDGAVHATKLGPFTAAELAFAVDELLAPVAR